MIQEELKVTFDINTIDHLGSKVILDTSADDSRISIERLGCRRKKCLY